MYFLCVFFDSLFICIYHVDNNVFEFILNKNSLFRFNLHNVFMYYLFSVISFGIIGLSHLCSWVLYKRIKKEILVFVQVNHAVKISRVSFSSLHATSTRVVSQNDAHENWSLSLCFKRKFKCFRTRLVSHARIRYPKHENTRHSHYVMMICNLYVFFYVYFLTVY